MQARERIAWGVAALFSLTSVAALVGWNAEHASRLADREQFEANIRLVQTHALRGLQLDAEKTKHDAGGDSPPQGQ